MRHAFYPVVVRHDRDGEDFIVELPDLGLTLSIPGSEDPYLAAIEAAIDDIQNRRLNHEPVPDPTPMQPHARGRGRTAPHMVFTVPVPLRRDYVRVALALRPELVRRIDSHATALGMTRSAFVSRIATDALAF